MSLINKYRPNSFGAVAGNKKTITGLKQMLDKQEPKRTYLLTGPRGCGKTTIGRIIAKHVGCDVDNNFIEMDSADFRGIDSVRAIRKTINLKGLGGGVKVYLFDECHKLTKDAQEALLKTLEEPPKHVFMILATTDPQMLKATVKDRCAEYSVTPLEDDECSTFLKKIIRREKATIPDDIVELIVERAEGRPRSCLALLEKLLELPEEEMEDALAKEKAAEYQIFDICKAMLSNSKWIKIAKILTSLKETGEDPESIRRMIMGYCNSVLLKSDNPNAFDILEAFERPTYDMGFPGVSKCCYRALLQINDK